MSSTERKVIYLHERDLEGSLERLNRITGLTFSRWPQSLVSKQAQPEPAFAMGLPRKLTLAKVESA